jgi:hypothetical protein
LTVSSASGEQLMDAYEEAQRVIASEAKQPTGYSNGDSAAPPGRRLTHWERDLAYRNFCAQIAEEQAARDGDSTAQGFRDRYEAALKPGRSK